MTFQKGDVVLVPLPFTDMQTGKVRPSVVLSSATYHATEPDLVLGAITTNLAAAASPVDYVLKDWAVAGLHYPSAFKPIFFTLEPSLVIHHIGRLSTRDMAEVECRLRRVFGLTTSALYEVLTAVELKDQPAALVQSLAERAIAALLAQATQGNPEAHPDRLRALFA